MAATQKGRRTAAAFLDAARQVFAEKGYFNAKIADIAEVAGRSPGSFYNYYENKEQILEALLEQFSAEVLEGSLQSRGSTPLEGIRSAVRAYWTTYRKYLPEMIGLFQMSMTDTEFALRWQENRAAGIRAVLSGIKSAERSGHLIGLDHNTLASALVSMLESFCWTWMAVGGDADMDAPDDETAIETLSAMWYRTVFHPVPECGCGCSKE